MKTKIDELISSISYDTIYQECFSILDATTVRLLSRWDILDPRLEPMIIDHHRSHTDIATTSIDIEELLAINLIFRNKTPNSIS